MADDLFEALKKEIKRGEELVERYRSIWEGLGQRWSWIQGDVDAGKKALKEGEAVAMVRALAALRECKERWGN